MKAWRIMGTILVAVAVYGIATSLPDIKRYVRISMM